MLFKECVLCSWRIKTLNVSIYHIHKKHTSSISTVSTPSTVYVRVTFSMLSTSVRDSLVSWSDATSSVNTNVSSSVVNGESALSPARYYSVLIWFWGSPVTERYRFLTSNHSVCTVLPMHANIPIFVRVGSSSTSKTWKSQYEPEGVCAIENPINE